MNKIYNLIVVILVAVIIITFFLPWMRIESEQVGTFTKILTGRRQKVVDSVSGFKVPILANSEDARLMISVIKMFKPEIKDVDKKSYLVWVVPALSLVILLTSFLLGKNKWVNLGIGLIGCTLFFTALYKIKATDLDKVVIKVVITPWLWLTLLAYLCIGLLGLANFTLLSIRKPKG